MSNIQKNYFSVICIMLFLASCKEEEKPRIYESADSLIADFKKAIFLKDTAKIREIARSWVYGDDLYPFLSQTKVDSVSILPKLKSNILGLKRLNSAHEHYVCYLRFYSTPHTFDKIVFLEEGNIGEGLHLVSMYDMDKNGEMVTKEPKPESAGTSYRYTYSDYDKKNCRFLAEIYLEEEYLFDPKSYEMMSESYETPKTGDIDLIVTLKFRAKNRLGAYGIEVKRFHFQNGKLKGMI